MNKYDLRKIFYLFFAMLFFIGCQGTRVIIENDQYPEDPPSYKKGGPPPWAPAHGYRAKHRYHYYPSSHVYYERERGFWFQYKDGEWRFSVSLPSEIRIDMNDYVVLEMETGRPYDYDHEVRKKYPPGQLKKKKGKKHKWKK
ncbi:hypothetical protein ACFL0H_08680 [Thermodesulfobacteriota bacterium]